MLATQKEKKEQIKQKPEEPIITISSDDINGFKITGEWVAQTMPNYTYTVYNNTVNTEPFNANGTYHLQEVDYENKWKR